MATTLYDIIMLGNGATATAGQTLTTAAGDLNSVVEPVDFTLATAGILGVGATFSLGGITYTITSAEGTLIDYTHDNGAGGLQTDSVKTFSFGAQDVNGNTINFLIPGDDVYGGDTLHGITELTVIAQGNSGGVNEFLLDNDGDVTLAGGGAGSTTTIYDAIEVSGGTSIAAGSSLVTASGDLVEVDEPLVFNVATAGELNIGDTVEIGGVAYSLQSWDAMKLGVTHTNGSVSTGGVEAAGLHLVDGNGNQLTYIIPSDGIPLPDITQIDVTVNAQSSAGFVNTTALDADDNVTLPAGAGNTTTMYDAISMSGGFPSNGDTLVTANGDLVSIVEPVTLTTVAAGTVQVGDTMTIGSTDYTLSQVKESYGDVTHDNGAGGLITEGPMRFLTLSGTDGAGNVVDLIVPTDADWGGDDTLHGITEISVTQIDAANGTYTTQATDIDGDVTLAGGAGSVETVYDMIELSGGVPVAGQNLVTANGDLVEIDEPVTFSTATAGQVVAGDTTTIGGIAYTVADVREINMDITHDDGAGGSITENWKGWEFTLQDAGGNTVDYILPVDDTPAHDFPLISNILVNGVSGPGNAISIDEVDSNDTVTLAAAAPLNYIVEGTGGNDLIDINYTGDPQGDKIDHNDNAAGNNDDVVQAGAGNDTVFAGLGDDAIDGGLGNDVLHGGVGNDIISGGTGAANGGDDMYGEDGDDTFVYTNDFNGDTASGGENVELGGDTLDGSAITNDVVLDLTAGNASNPEDGTLQSLTTGDLSNFEEIENFVLGSGDDTIQGASGGIVSVAGGAGDDTFNTGAGVEDLDGGSGDDTFNGISVGDTINGGETGETNGDTLDLTNAAPAGGSITVTYVPGSGNEDGTVEFFDAGGVSQGTATFQNIENIIGAPTSTVTIYDAIELNGILPTSGNALLTTAAGDLIEVDEPLTFTVATAGQLDVGDTVVIGGDTFTIQHTYKTAGDYTSGGAVVNNVYGYGMHLTGPGGATLDYVVPLDNEGNLPDISQIDIHSEQIDDPIGIGQLDTDDTVTLICFAGGTRIMTTAGELKVEDLEIGQMVQTMDHGLQPIRWIGRRKVAAKGDFAPIMIKKGALGNTRDIRVSPQHRMLISGWQAEMLFDENQVLAAAKHLVNGDTIYVDHGDEVEYFHIMFDQHEVIFAEGAPSESFHPGEMGLNSIQSDQRDELLKLFPELETSVQSYGDSARITLKSFEAKLLGNVA